MAAYQSPKLLVGVQIPEGMPSYSCMKRIEKCLGRGFDSRLVHQRYITPLTPRGYLEAADRKHIVRSVGNSSISLMGQSWFRQGKEYGSGQLGNAETVRIGDTRS